MRRVSMLLLAVSLMLSCVAGSMAQQGAGGSGAPVPAPAGNGGAGQGGAGQGAGGLPIRSGPTSSLSPFACRTKGFFEEGQLPNLKQALKDGDGVRILSIGASSFGDYNVLGGGPDAQLARMLNAAVSGLHVAVVNRGFSGELARQAAERIKLEAALEEPTMVLWQVGTADAFARIPIAEFSETLRSTVRWLKARDIDVVLVGLHYLRQWSRDTYVQSIRAAVRKVALEEKVLRIGRYKAEELIATAATTGPRPDAFALTEAGYECMAGYVARAIAVGLYAKSKKAPPGMRNGL